MLETLSKYKGYSSKKTVLLVWFHITPVTLTHRVSDLAGSYSKSHAAPHFYRQDLEVREARLLFNTAERVQSQAWTASLSAHCPSRHASLCPCLATSLQRWRDPAKYIYWLHDKDGSPVNCFILLVIVSFPSLHVGHRKFQLEKMSDKLKC